MANEKGLVVRSYGDAIPMVLVRIGRSLACKSCSSKSSCVGEGDKKNIEIELSNTVGAAEGDLVLLKIDAIPLLTVSFLVYILPILSMIGGAFLGHGILLFFNPIMSSKLPEILAIIFLIFSFGGIRIIGDKLSTKSKYKPKILRLVNGSSSFNCIIKN